MKTALQMLSDEHKNILKVIGALLKECELLESGEPLKKEFFIKAIDFIRNYADKFHHAKEEDILFHELNQCAEQGKTHCNPVKQMLYEHEEGRKYVKEMGSGIKENDKQKIIENARGYARLLQDHIYKEDNILYPMTDEALDNKDKEEMSVQFKNVNKKMSQEIEKHITFSKTL
jgi:hemerythrin-like domain-containing protein